MIIGIDARELEGRPTGVGNYLWNILKRLSLPNGVSLQLYFKNEIPAELETLPDVEKILLESSRSNLFWQQWQLSREVAKRGVDLFFSPNGTCPWIFFGIHVITVHDLSFFRHPQWFSLKERTSRQMNTFISLKQADRIYVDSPFIQEEVVSRLNVPESRFVLTRIGVDPKKNDPSRRTLLRRSYDLDGREIVLYVGSIFNRRHLPVLIEAFRETNKNSILVLIGENRTHPHQDLPGLIAKYNLQDRVRLLEYVPDQVVQDYYQMADLFVYLSTYEGFGIPPLEAMSYGIPVILSETPAMDEIYSGAAYFVKSITPPDVAAAIHHCLSNQEERSRLAEAGIALASRHKWEDTAQLISEDWERLIATGR